MKSGLQNEYLRPMILVSIMCLSFVLGVVLLWSEQNQNFEKLDKDILEADM